MKECPYCHVMYDFRLGSCPYCGQVYVWDGHDPMGAMTPVGGMPAYHHKPLRMNRTAQSPFTSQEKPTVRGFLIFIVLLSVVFVLAFILFHILFFGSSCMLNRWVDF